VHRIVLSTFAPIENWEVLTVNHIDGNCLNNNLENLEWMSQSENTVYSRSVLQTGNRTRRVHIITLRGEEKFYESVTEAAKQLGFSKTAISNWANKKRNYEGKFKLVEYV
jgi:DNA-binding transcriptional regulator YiaG